MITILDGLPWALVEDAVTASSDSSRKKECVDVCDTLVVRLITTLLITPKTSTLLTLTRN
jgi:hypothetical protein